MSTYIKNCNRLKFRQTKLDSVSEETIFMDWTDDELESLGEIDVHYSGIVSNYDEIEPTSISLSIQFDKSEYVMLYFIDISYPHVSFLYI